MTMAGGNAKSRFAFAATFAQSNAVEYSLLLGFFALRLHRLMAMPLFYDEMLHIGWARHMILYGEYFNALNYARWLNVAILALFQPLGSESPWLARSVMVVFSMLAAAASFGLGRWLGLRPAGRIALIVYGLLPFAVFYDRQTLADPLLAAFGALGLVCLARMASGLRWRDAVIAGLFLAAAILTKFSAVLLLPLPVLAAVIAPRERSSRRRALLLSFAALATTFTVGGLAFAIIRLKLPGNDQLANIHLWCHSPQCQGQISLSQTLQLTATNIRLYIETIPAFFTIPVWLAAVAAPIFRKQIRRILLLCFPAFALVAPFIVTADLFPPRYFVFALVPVAALAAFTTVNLWQTVTSRATFLPRPAVKPLAFTAFALVLFSTPLVVDAQLLWSPFSAPIAPFEKRQYAAAWPGGIAGQKIVAALLAEPGRAKRRINVLASGLWLEVYTGWGESQGTVSVFENSAEQENEIAAWLASGDPLYFVEVSPKYDLPQRPYGVELELIREYDMPGSGDRPDIYGGPSVARLWKVAGTDAELSSKIAGQVFGDPAKLSDDYTAVANYLSADPQAVVLLYPPHQFDVLQDQPGINADRLRPVADSWPVNFDDVENDLAQLTDSPKDVFAVFVFEGRGDPGRRIETWLSTHLYPVSEQWFGPIRVLRYGASVDAKETAPQPINVVYAHQIELAEVATLDSVSQAGGSVRMALTWRAVSVPAASYKVFVHVFDSQGQLAAQHDGVPQNGLAPTHVWQTGQTIVDRFAIALPPDLPSGSYTIKVGLYDQATGQRLLTAAGADSVEVGQITLLSQSGK